MPRLQDLSWDGSCNLSEDCSDDFERFDKTSDTYKLQLYLLDNTTRMF